MAEIGSQNPLHAARHEAGHAVIALRKGFHPRAIRLWQENSRWVGDCDCGEARINTKMGLSFGAGSGSVDTTDAENHVAKSIAGALAQTRSIAEETFGSPATFATDAPIDALIHILLNEVRTGENVRAGRCDIQFSASGETVLSVMEGSWVSGADIAGLRNAAQSTMFFAKQVTEDAVRDAMTLLNDELNWQVIASLADKLMQQAPSGDPPKHVLKGESLTQVTQSLGISRT